MKTSRAAPISLNKPKQVYGFDPQGLTYCTVGAALGILVLFVNPTLGCFVVAGSAIALGCVRLYGKHRVLIVSFWRALWQKARYEPTRRDVFKMEIK